MALSTNDGTKIFLLVQHYSIYMATKKSTAKDKASKKTTKKTTKKSSKASSKKKSGAKAAVKDEEIVEETELELEDIEELDDEIVSESDDEELESSKEVENLEEKITDEELVDEELTEVEESVKDSPKDEKSAEIKEIAVQSDKDESEDEDEREEIMRGLEEMGIDTSSLSPEDLEEMITEYKEIHSLEIEEMDEIEQAIEEVKQESEMDKLAREIEGDVEEAEEPKEESEMDKLARLIEGEVEEEEEKKLSLADELERQIEAAMEKKEKKKKKEIMTEDRLIEYLTPRRSKIIYFALWDLTMNIEDHQATKQALYERLKDVTSMDPIDPINEHKFYFGLGYILRLKLYESPIVVFKTGRLKINVNVENLKKILQTVGEPISQRPVIPEEKKKEMIEDFFSDSFFDL